RLGIADRSLCRVAEGDRLAFGASFFRDFVQFGLGALDLSEGGNVLTRVERAFDQVAADSYQSAEQCQIVDLLCEVPRPDHGRARSRQLGEIGGSANVLDRFVSLKQGP